MVRRVEIVTVCEHGKAGKHLLAEKRFDGCDQCRSGEHGCGNPHFDCPGGSRRVLEPGEAERIIARVLAALRPCAEADVAILDAAVAIVDALAGGEQP